MQSDWNETDANSKAFIKNKPTIHDFTHSPNTIINSPSTTITFSSGQRCSKMITVSSDIDITIICNNQSDNYIWIKNTSNSDVDITINSVTLNGTLLSNVYMPTDGISVLAGGICEIGVIANQDGAFLTSRNDLKL